MLTVFGHILDDERKPTLLLGQLKVSSSLGSDSWDVSRSAT